MFSSTRFRPFLVPETMRGLLLLAHAATTTPPLITDPVLRRANDAEREWTPTTRGLLGW